MTTASNPSGSGSPVSISTNAPVSRSSGVVSLAPAVSAARTAIPSIAAESNGGEERRAQIAAAVTRPTQLSTGTVTASRRGGQPAAAQHSRHADCALAAGTSWRKGLVPLAIREDLDGLARGQAIGVLGHDHVAVGRGEDRQQRR